MKFLLALLLPIFVQAQKMPLTGEIIADSNFICRDKYPSDTSAFGVREICNSENYIEIRLKTYIMASCKLIVFSFNNNQWVADKYYLDYITKRKKVISVIPKRETKKDSAGLFNNLFDNLKSNNVFLIPDQQKLKEQLTVFHGILYSFTFKVGNLYRRYYYGSPEMQAEYYPLVPEYKQINDIITLLNGIF